MMKPRPLKFRLTIIVVILMAVPILSSLLICLMTSHAYNKTVERLSGQIVEEKIQRLDSFYQDVNLILQQMVDQSAMIEFLSADEDTEEYGLQKAQSTMAAMLDNIIATNQRRISAIYVIPTDKTRQIVFKRSVGYVMEPVYRYQHYSVEERTLESPLALWTFDWAGATPYVGASLRIYNAQRDLPLGTMILRLRHDYFRELVGANDSTILLQLKDRMGNIIYSYGLAEEGLHLGQQVNAANYNRCTASSAASGWQLTCYIPYEQLDRQMEWILLLLMLEIPLLLIMIVLATRLLRKWVYQPVRHLAEAMRNFSLVEPAYIPADDELKDISIGFDHMRARIVSLIEDVRLEDEKRSQMELQMLQMQIMPHFLFNTLNTIKSLLALGNVDKATTTLQAFMEMLRMSLSDVRSIITLNEEIHYLQQYVMVMSIRRKTEIQTVLQVEDECQGCMVPKFVLQPLAENSILHGFASLGEQTPTMTLIARREGEDLFLILEDNGSGIPKEQIELFNQRKKGQFTGIGLSNVHARIQLLFGDGYGVNIQSGQDGTKVIVHLPFK